MQPSICVELNYNVVIVTTPVKHRGMPLSSVNESERSEIQVKASTPRDPALFGQLLDRVVHELVLGQPDPTRALALAGRAVHSTPWAGYRTGRARLATAAAAYLSWLAPPEPWVTVEVAAVSSRRPIGWRSPEGALVIDVLAAGSREVTSLGRAVLRAGTGAVAIRSLDVTAPARSKVFVTGVMPMMLAESDWVFEGRVR
jgi:hypothetical protein